MAGGCSDDDLVRSGVEAAVNEVDAPARHFSDKVAAGACAAAILKRGSSAVAVPSDVVDMADRRITKRIPTALITQLDEFGQPAVEAASVGVTAHNRAASGLPLGWR